VTYLFISIPIKIRERNKKKGKERKGKEMIVFFPLGGTKRHKERKRNRIIMNTTRTKWWGGKKEGRKIQMENKKAGKYLNSLC
jgi:hypothetical protein